MKSLKTLTRTEVINLRITLFDQGKSICGRCRRVKKLGEFVRDETIWNGVTNRCRECTAELALDYRMNGPKRKKVTPNKVQFLLCPTCRVKPDVLESSSSEKAIITRHATHSAILIVTPHRNTCPDLNDWMAHDVKDEGATTA